jgi:hypothetical protein
MMLMVMRFYHRWRASRLTARQLALLDGAYERWLNHPGAIGYTPAERLRLTQIDMRLWLVSRKLEAMDYGHGH